MQADRGPRLEERGKSSGRHTAGLTLLEVLAAFLIFSLVFTVLVGSSQNAVRTQGLSLRRLEAKEIADSVMTDLEIAMARRALPVVEEEIEREPFTVRVRESSFIPEPGPGMPAPDAREGLAAASDITAVLAAEMPAIAPYLRRYDIEVEWSEGPRLEKLTRTTFAFDWAGAAEELAKLLPEGATVPGSSAASSSDGVDREDGTSTPEGGDSRGRDRDRSQESEIDRMKRLIREAEGRL